MVPDDTPTGIQHNEKVLLSEELARDPTEEKPAHLTGVRLFLVMIALLIGMFLVRHCPPLVSQIVD